MPCYAVGCFNHTGKCLSTRFEDWTCDEIVELAAEAGVAPSFPIPDILATHIVTNETFGIIAIPDTLVNNFGMKSMPSSESQVTPLVKDTPVHLLTRLTTRPISPYIFLAERQQTVHAVIPIHTAEEYALFTNLMNSGNWFKPSSHMPIAGKTFQTVNFRDLAKRWNEIVHEHAAAPNLQSGSIFYKLPEQLERHHKLWLEARGRRATLAITTEQRKPVTAVLTDPNRRSHVLPAIIMAPPSDLHNTSSVPSSHKRKERANPSPIFYKSATGHKPTAPASGIGVASTSTSNAGRSIQKTKTKKVCTSCKANGCSNTPTCKGSGNRKLCVCTTHPVAKNPRAPK